VIAKYDVDHYGRSGGATVTTSVSPTPPAGYPSPLSTDINALFSLYCSSLKPEPSECP
jgi:hypothetical protein